LDDVELEGFGLYSEHHRGVYTNMVSNMHMHFRVKQGPQFRGGNQQGAPTSEEFIGHLDDEVELIPGGKLFLPKAI
jgi:hypothetical protein